MDDKYKYCPRCGNIEIYDFKYCQFCLKDISFFDRNKESKKAILIKTDIDLQEPWEINEPCDLCGCTEDLYRHIWETYVDIPGNGNLNREAHEALKADRLAFFHKGGIAAKIEAEERAASEPVRCPKCRSTSISTQSGFATGGAVAGAVIAGTAGALIGGKGGNKMINVCQKCGHKWEPGAK